MCSAFPCAGRLPLRRTLISLHCLRSVLSLHTAGCLHPRLPSAAQDFSEWAQCQVLEFVRHYRPTGEQEVYDIMNVLDDRLSHSNSAVVMATVKVFLHFTLSMPATHQQVGLFRVHFQCTKCTSS